MTELLTQQLTIEMLPDELAAQLAAMEKEARQLARRHLGLGALDLHSALLQQSLAIEAETGIVEPVEVPSALVRPDLTSPEVQCEVALQRRSANRQISNIAGVLSIIERDTNAPEWSRRLLSQL